MATTIQNFSGTLDSASLSAGQYGHYAANIYTIPAGKIAKIVGHYGMVFLDENLGVNMTCRVNEGTVYTFTGDVGNTFSAGMSNPVLLFLNAGDVLRIDMECRNTTGSGQTFQSGYSFSIIEEDV